MRRILFNNTRLFCDLASKNRRFIRKVGRYQKDFYIHQKASEITDEKLTEFVANTPREKIAHQMARKSSYDKELKDFISNFNLKHKNQITLLDFSKYTTEFGDLKNEPLRRQDVEMLKEFQKRKVDQKIAEIKKKYQKKDEEFVTPVSDLFVQKQFMESPQEDAEAYHKAGKVEEKEFKFIDEAEFPNDDTTYQQGPFEIKDSFVMLLLNVRSNTKVTTLNRINSYKTLLFMGNGNGIVSYAKGRGITPAESLERAVYLCKKNLIAIPRDVRCTLPLAINKKFQDYWLYVKPIPGFNAFGHPTIALMLTLAGIDHCRFHVAHTDKNVYNVLKVFYKVVTANTTPQELAEREGFKVYRHQWIRPLTYRVTHCPLSR